jgi:hypothetical protein
MRASRSSGSVEGVVSNHDPYSDSDLFKAVPMPIANTPNGIAPNRPETIGRLGDQGPGTR